MDGSKFGIRGVGYVLCLVIPDFLQNVITSINGPLYPPEAAQRGLNDGTYGLVLSFFRGVLIVFVILIGTQVERFGLKPTFVCSILLNAFAPLLFAFITYVKSGPMFLLLSFILRGLEGIGASGLLAAMYMWPSVLFPGKVSLVFGFIQTGFLLSGTIGPLLGTLLDASFGFTATYSFFGLLQLVAAVSVAAILPNSIPIESLASGTKELLKQYWTLLKIPSVLLYVFACAVGGASGDSVTAVLQPTLERYGLSQLEVGWMFMLMGVPQLGAPVWGFMMDRMKRPQLLVLGGSLSVVGACIVLAPFPGIPPSFPLFAAGLFLVGFSHGLLVLASVCNFRLELIRQGFQENLQNISFVSIAYLSSSSVGAAVGPLVSGLVYNSNGFAAVMLFPSAINILLAILVTCQICSLPIPNSTTERPLETEPLIARNT